MDWTEQSEAMLKNWTEVQKKMWDSWLAGVRDAGRPATTDAWQRVIGQASQAWSESVGRALDAQVEWTRIWAATLAEGEPAEVGAWARQFAQAMQGWVEMQKQVWAQWFETVRKFGPEQTAGGWETIWKTWEATARQGLDAQAAWSKAWTPPASPARRSRV